MRVFAFQGTRYSSRHRSPGALAAPPYDQIDEALRDRLHRDEFSFSHLSRPVAAGDLDPHRHAADLLARWRSDGTVTVDSEPSLYPYELVLSAGGRRLGLTAMVGIEEAASGIIRPHELTVAKTVEERLGLVRATGADFGPVLLLAEDEGRLDDLLAEDVDAGASLAEHTDGVGNRHRLFRIADPRRLATYRDSLASSAGLIADGHHRYTVARLWADESGAPPGSPAAAKLAVVTSLDSAGLTIDPIHRALRAAVGLDSPSVAVLRREPWLGDDGVGLAAAVASAEQPAVGIAATGRGPEIWHLDRAIGPPELPPAASDLAVVLLHHALLPAWGLAPESAVDGTVLYRSDPADLWSSMASDEFSTGIFLPPMSTAGFAAAIADGDVLPPKSTRFLPKVVSGLVWAAHDGTLA